MDYMAKGIYKITNDRTGETYIGQTNNLYYREKQHMEDLASGTHHNRGMQQDYNRGDTFSFKVLEYVDGTRQDLHNREKAYINDYNSFHAGYNQTPGGEYDKYKGSYGYGGGRKHKYANKKSYASKSNYSKPRTTSYSPTSDTSFSLYCMIGLLIVFIGALFSSNNSFSTLLYLIIGIFVLFILILNRLL